MMGSSYKVAYQVSTGNREFGDKLIFTYHERMKDEMVTVCKTQAAAVLELVSSN